MLRQVTRIFGGRAALNNVSCSFEKGKIYALIGPNGAGKTTLIHIVNDVIRASGGEVLLDGEPHDKHRNAAKNVYTVLAGDRGMYWRLTGRQNAVYFLSLKGMSRARAEQKIREGVSIMGEGFSLLLDRRMEELSFGQKKLIGVFAGIVSDAGYLIIDEITEGLDVDIRQELALLLRRVAASGKAVIFATHDLPFAQSACDTAIFSRGGEIRSEVPVDEQTDLLRIYKSIHGEEHS